MLPLIGDTSMASSALGKTSFSGDATPFAITKIENDRMEGKFKKK